MKRIFEIKNWSHDPKRRKHRFRCMECDKIISDGTDVVIERRGKSSHGYHKQCFGSGLSSQAALARAHGSGGVS